MVVKELIKFKDVNDNVLKKEKSKLSIHKVEVLYLETEVLKVSKSVEESYEVILENKDSLEKLVIVRDKELDKKQTKDLIKVSDETFEKLLDSGIDKGLDLYDLKKINYSKGNMIIRDCNDIELIIVNDLIMNRRRYYVRPTNNFRTKEDIEVTEETFNKLQERYKRK